MTSTRKFLFILNNYDINDISVSGLGLRYLEICHALSNFFECTIFVKKSNYPFTDTRYVVKIVNDNNVNIYSLINDTDYVFFSDMPDMDIMNYCKKHLKTIISENMVPIEHMEYPEIKYSESKDLKYNNLLNAFFNQISLSDIFIARSSIEFQIMISILIMLKKITIDDYLNNNYRNKIFYIPIGFSKASLQYSIINTNSECFRICWNGGIWDYLDVDWINNINIKNNVRIQFMYANENNIVFKGMKMLHNLKKNSNNIDLLNISFSKRDEYLSGIDVFICIGKPIPENFTCHRLRIRDVLVYKKPIIIDSYGATAQIIESLKIGIVVKNYSEIEEAIEQLMDNEIYSYYVKNIEKCRDDFMFENTLLDIKDYLL